MSELTEKAELNSATGASAGAAALLSGRIMWLAAALFFLGFAYSSGLARTVGAIGFELFQHIARAQYELHLATQNVNADGLAEYAVLTNGEAADAALSRFVGTRDRWQARPASLPGWQIVAAPVEDSGAARLLRDQTFAKAVLRNRGLWICH
ncbi:MAG: hypothetical protein AAF458_13140 [Pseudomonadota bacterium]